MFGNCLHFIVWVFFNTHLLQKHSKVSSTLLPSFVEVLSNLKERFRDMELLQAFKKLAMRPISFVDKNKLDNWGMEPLEEMEILQQFADEKTLLAGSEKHQHRAFCHQTRDHGRVETSEENSPK